MQSLLMMDVAAELIVERERRAEGARLRRAVRRHGPNRWANLGLVSFWRPRV